MTYTLGGVEMVEFRTKEPGQASRLFLVLALLGALALSSTGCGTGEEELIAPAPEGFSAEEAEAYWAADAVKKALREDAIRHDEVVVEWRGDWSLDAKLALFVGLTHQSDVKVFCEALDLVERDQITLKEFKNEAWNAVVSIPNNLEPGGKIVFVR